MGKGGGKGHTPREAPDNLKSTQLLSVIDAISEGPIEGPVNGLQSVLVNQTPVVDRDGNTNIHGVKVVYRVGEQEQTPLEGFESSGAETVLGVQVKYDNPVTRTITAANIDRLRFTFGVQSLVEANSKGDRNPTSVRLQIHLERYGQWVVEKEITITGKTTTQYLASVIVDNLPPRPFGIRMVRVTADSTTDQLQNNTVWSSYTEIIVYVSINQYAYSLIAQCDYTSNANVTLYSAPEYSETKPTNATNGQTYTLFNSMMKPTASEVGALSVNGGRLNGSLGIGTDNALGGNSIVLGDNDTGLKQNGDGILDIFANNQHTVRIAPGEMIVLGAIRAGNGKKLLLTSTNNSALNAGFNLWGDGGNRPTVIELGDDQGWHLYSQRNTDGSIQFVVNGQIIPDNYGNFDARYLTSGNVYTKGESDNRYVQDIQRGAPVFPGKVDEYGPAEAPAGCFLTQARHDPTTSYGVTFAYRPLQMWVGNGWRTING